MHHLALSSQDPAHRPSATRPVGPALPDRRPAARARHSLLVNGYPGLGLPHGCGSYPGALSRYLLAAPRTREPYAVPARTPVDGGPLCACCSPPRAPGNPSRFRPGPGCSPRLRLLVPGDLTRWRIPHRPLSPVPARCPVGQGTPCGSGPDTGGLWPSYRQVLTAPRAWEPSRFRPGHGWTDSPPIAWASDLGYPGGPGPHRGSGLGGYPSGNPFLLGHPSHDSEAVPQNTDGDSPSGDPAPRATRQTSEYDGSSGGPTPFDPGRESHGRRPLLGTLERHSTTAIAAVLPEDAMGSTPVGSSTLHDARDCPGSTTHMLISGHA